ncbi:helix-turn-helix domain-containing protein [Streptomyces sp. NPDC012438]|uniref:helix-turn-helix domain-containing protein n=1 Tax=Streptomyces TaxID=1883 RepID=UPI00345FDD02
MAVIAGSDVDDVERDFNAEIGRRVREARARAKLTQELLARKAGLTRGSITNIESGMQAPPPYRLVRLASALGVKPADLLPGLQETSQVNGLPDYLADAVASVASEAFERRVRDGQV